MMSARQHEDLLRQEGFRTPWGDGFFRLRGGLLVEVALPHPPVWPEAGGGPPMPREIGGPGEQADDPVSRWRERLEAYFEDPATHWDPTDLRLDALTLGRFQRDVYAALIEVAVGETVAYGELARLAGHPGAARAVGTAMARNPLAIVIPCHRVVRSDGSLGRYGRCDAYKQALLRLEGALTPAESDREG